MSETKECKICGANQLLEKFKPDRRSNDNLAAICTPCLDERESRVIHPAEHEVMFVKQNQGCAICKRPIFISKILVDYDRRTQEVFGLVCRECNRALRDIKRDPVIAVAMLGYLTQNRGETPNAETIATFKRTDAGEDLYRVGPPPPIKNINLE